MPIAWKNYSPSKNNKLLRHVHVRKNKNCTTLCVCIYTSPGVLAFFISGIYHRVGAPLNKSPHS